MQTAETVPVRQTLLNDIEERSVLINVKLHSLTRMIESGEPDRAKSLVWILQGLNAKQGCAAIALGAIDSAAAATGGDSPMWKDCEAPVDADGLDFSDFRGQLSPE